MVKVIYPVDPSTKKKTNPARVFMDIEPPIAIFLAGPCPRVNYSEDWRFEAIKYLEELGYDGVVFNPTNPSYDDKDPNFLDFQVAWELDAMDLSDRVVFWIPRDDEHPAFTTNIELGHYLWPSYIDEILIGFPDNAAKMDYIKKRLERLDKSYDNDLKTLMQNVVKELQ